MNQQPDKLFRDKLEGYQKPVPASAWEKIAAAQTKKNSKPLWLKIAASILMVAVAAYLLWPKHDAITAPENSLTQTPLERENKVTAQPQPKTNNIAQVEEQKPVEKTIPKQKSVEKLVVTEQPDNKSVVMVEDQSTPATNDLANTDIAVAENNDTLVAAETKESSQQNITLVFTAKDVDSYLDKKALAEATSDEKKSSTFKKLLKKANDLTNNQDPFGELRQKKNEILALNFKNEKRGQNK